jgi:hypothetical protein
MKRLSYIAAVIVAVLLGCMAANHSVTVIEKTRTYHRSDCARVKMAKTVLMPLDEAHELHLVPCPYCHPDSNG